MANWPLRVYGSLSTLDSHMIYDNSFLDWVEKLTGLESSRVDDAIQKVQSWGIGHINHELLSISSIDNAVALTLLSEAIEELRCFDIPESKLMAKLRQDRHVWPTWAELRAATLLLRVSEQGTLFQLEADRSAGKHADFRFTSSTGVSASIEFKAIGLSDEEYSFCRRVAPAPDFLLPPYGLLTLHAQLDLNRVPLDDSKLAEMHANAAKASAIVPDYPNGLGGVTIVGHGSEASYNRRLRLRLRNEVLRQIPKSGDAWAAFYWTNGTPISSLISELRWEEFPQGLAGIILLGDAVAFPHANIHSYIFIIPRGAVLGGQKIVSSEVSENLARLVAERFENSSGVRPTLLSATENRRRVELLRRDGSRRIMPFNLLMDKDLDNAFGRRGTS